jgi:hypothetical protein
MSVEQVSAILVASAHGARVGDRDHGIRTRHARRTAPHFLPVDDAAIAAHEAGLVAVDADNGTRIDARARARAGSSSSTRSSNAAGRDGASSSTHTSNAAGRAGSTGSARTANAAGRAGSTGSARTASAAGRAGVFGVVGARVAATSHDQAERGVEGGTPGDEPGTHCFAVHDEQESRHTELARISRFLTVRSAADEIRSPGFGTAVPGGSLHAPGGLSSRVWNHRGRAGTLITISLPRAELPIGTHCSASSVRAAWGRCIARETNRRGAWSR